MVMKQALKTGVHLFEIMHPYDDIPYEGTAVSYFCSRLQISREVILRFPNNSRLFVDGRDAGRLVDVFTEEAAG
jgi:hypothetical protein